MAPASANAVNGFVWDVSPILWQWGPLTLRTYGLFMGLTILVGYTLLSLHLRARGCSRETVYAYFLYALAGFAIGARLGHCFFYNPLRYARRPWELLFVWQGGLASHGAALGLTAAALLFWRRRHVSLPVLSDATALPAAVGATLVRVGNFFNSEIVGRVTQVPWAVRFLRRDAQPRHPSQLYEALGGLAVLTVLLIMHRHTRRLKPGVMAATFLIVYFTFRFLIEFVKEYHVLSAGLTVGQYLSLPMIGVGVLYAVAAYRAGPPNRADP